MACGFASICSPILCTSCSLVRILLKVTLTGICLPERNSAISSLLFIFGLSLYFPGFTFETYFICIEAQRKDFSLISNFFSSKMETTFSKSDPEGMYRNSLSSLTFVKLVV